MMILAQIGGSGAATASVPMLPSPPALPHYLLENPWPVAAGLAVGALIGAFVLNRRGRLKDGLRVLVVGVVASVGVWVLASSITTERESLQARTKEVVDLTAAARTGELADMLTERISVSSPAGAPAPKGREQVLESVRQTMNGLLQIKEHTVGPVRAVVDGPNVARTQVRVWVRLKGEAALYDAPLGGWFRIGWTRELGVNGAPDGPWRVTSITVLQVDGLGVNANAPD